LPRVDDYLVLLKRVNRGKCFSPTTRGEKDLRSIVKKKTSSIKNPSRGANLPADSPDNKIDLKGYLDTRAKTPRPS